MGQTDERRPRVAMPLYAVCHQVIGGTESAIYNLIKGLRQFVDLDLYYSSRQRLAPEFLEWMDAAPEIKQIRTAYLARAKNIRFLEEFIFGLRHAEADFFLYPNYFCPPTFRRNGAKLGAVLFDIQYKTLPQYHNRRRRLWLDFYLKKLFASADYVYLLSEFERANILRCFGDRAARKCVVGYVAIEWSRFQGSSDEPPQRPLDNPYILSVCHHFPHKNVTTLAKAFDALSSQHRDLHLVLVGRQSPDNLAFVQRSLSPRSATRVHFTGFVSDAELGSWYRHARLFALPSIYEGFGMPAVEAMGLGIRTIVSDAGALPEVTLNKAEYVRNPLDVDEWISAIGSNLDTPRLAPTLSEEIRSRYSIESIARRYLSVLHN